jgi:hypothetical protein
MHPFQAPAQNYKIRAIHQAPSNSNGYVAIFTSFINGQYRQMWCNCSPSDPAKLGMGFQDNEPTMLGSEVLYIDRVFIPLEYTELTFAQLCQIIKHNGEDWAQTDFETCGVYAPKIVNKRTHRNMHTNSIYACVAHTRKWQKHASFYF